MAYPAELGEKAMNNPDVVWPDEPTEEGLGLIASVIEIRRAADEAERLVNALEDLRISFAWAKEALGGNGARPS